jgi:hypothetical protein
VTVIVPVPGTCGQGERVKEMPLPLALHTADPPPPLVGEGTSVGEGVSVWVGVGVPDGVGEG